MFCGFGCGQVRYPGSQDKEHCHRGESFPSQDYGCCACRKKYGWEKYWKNETCTQCRARSEDFPEGRKAAEVLRQAEERQREAAMCGFKFIAAEAERKRIAAAEEESKRKAAEAAERKRIADYQ